ncbi:hypothetical protein ACFQV2_24615 [Actinokineospora soli]|uniref:ABC transmembrane type-1 domain-containing protein n=1 Tax=Actinokineospora soli TaxID=1048753 RepID=A0ABW2TSE5_9PSEU
MSDLVERNASHITTVRALGSGALETSRLSALSDRIRAVQVRSARLRTAYPPLLVGVVDVGVIAVLWLGARRWSGEPRRWVRSSRRRPT